MATLGPNPVSITDALTQLTFLTDRSPTTTDEESQGAFRLLAHLPGGTWHRFETPEQVKLLSVTPQPTDHTPDQPT